MSSIKLGFVKSGKSKKRVEVKWDSYSHEVYVAWGGWTYAGKAYSASEAMNRAEAWLYNK
jgi:hypothetical protein